MKKYICCYYWGTYIESDTILANCSYYAEIKVIDPHELGRLKRCSNGSRTQNAVLRNIMNDNEVKRNSAYEGYSD